MRKLTVEYGGLEASVTIPLKIDSIKDVDEHAKQISSIAIDALGTLFRLADTTKTLRMAFEWWFDDTAKDELSVIVRSKEDTGERKVVLRIPLPETMRKLVHQANLPMEYSHYNVIFQPHEIK